MSLTVRRTLPLLLTTIIGLIMVFETITGIGGLKTLGDMIRNWAIILSGFGLLVGAGHILLVHGAKISKRTSERWPYSVILVASMIMLIVVGMVTEGKGPIYGWLSDAILLPASAVFYSILAFYIISAAIRAFQARNLETTVFLVCALLVVFGNIPSSAIIAPQIAAIGQWITSKPGMAAFRGLLIAAAIGGIIMAIRTLMGRETGYLGERPS